MPHCSCKTPKSKFAIAELALSLTRRQFLASSAPFALAFSAFAGVLLARCGGKDKYMPIVETLFAKQADWIVKEPLPPLKDIAKQFGITESEFNDCLANQKLLDSIQAVRDHAAQKLGVNSTPTFFVNGK